MPALGRSFIKMADSHKHVRKKDCETCDQLLFSIHLNKFDVWRTKNNNCDPRSLSSSHCLPCNNGFPCTSQSVLINILINGPSGPGDQVYMRYVWESRSGGFRPRCAGNLMLYWRAEMCLLGAISHCLTWHGSGHPRVCAMKGFLFDARALIVGKKLSPEKN